MAVRDNVKKGREINEPSRLANEIVGIIWIFCGLAMLLSLVRYSPADLPKWGILDMFSSTSEQAGENLLGVIGGLLGFIQILIFGAAAYLMPVGFAWFGILKLKENKRIYPYIGLGLVFTMVSFSCVLHAGGFFEGWAKSCKVVSSGGMVGECIGGYLMLPLLGRVGTVLISLMVYVIAFILLMDHKPIGFVKLCGSEFKKWRVRRRMEKAHSNTLAVKEAELQLERERQREQRKREREAMKASRPEAKEDEDPQSQLPLREIPTPQIIDASHRKANAMMAPGAKPFERKKVDHQFLSVSNFENYELPGFELLDAEEEEVCHESNREELLQTQRVIIETLKAFGIDVSPGDITRGPTITRYEIYPSTGLRVSRISQLEADIARATRAERINILAPIPGKDTVGIEIANLNKVPVPLHELLHDPEFRSAKKKIPLALGKDVYGKTVIGDLAAMPHCLVAGATGSGKSVCINSIIASMLFKFGPDELRFIMVDPKVVEMQMYNRLPHMVVPVVTDPKKTVAALKWVVNEMEKRYRIFAREGVRNFDSFNNRPKKEVVAEPAKVEKKAEVAEQDQEREEMETGLDPSKPASHQAPPWTHLDEDGVDQEQIESVSAALAAGELGPEADENDDDYEIPLDRIPDRFPYIVVLIDELADLMQTAPADVEMCIARIAQKARAAGIHLIIATQTPRADVVTGIIKANIPCRIAFQVSSQLDSRVILDTKGAEKLVGKGDMLYLPPGSAKLERAQGAYVTDAEIERIIDHCAKQGEPKFESEIQGMLSNDQVDEEEMTDADEELIIRCIEVVRQEQKASTSLLQRRLRLGYTRAARMIDILEQRGVVGPGDGAKAREVFMK